MHTVPMSTARTTSRLLGLSATAVLLAAGLTGCSGSDGTPSGTGSTTPAGTASASAYLPVPDGVELTPPGTQLSVGDHAVVAYEPRQDEVGALDLDVTKLEKASIKPTFSAWQLSSDQKSSTPYFVHVRVKNVGDTDLGGRRVPLYVVDDQNVLLESTPFASSFAPCPSTPLPATFKPGDATDVCLVYLAPKHGRLTAVSFRPEETFDPILWTGEVSKYVAPKPGKDKGKGKSPGKKKHGQGKNG